MGKKSRMKWLKREQEEERGKNKWKKWVLGIVIVLLVAGAGVGGYFGYKYYKNKKGNDTVTATDTKKDNQVAVLETSMGVIKFRLYSSAAPRTVENFVGLINKGFYNGVKFHRVIKDFMIQSGDPFSKDDSKKDSWGTGGESIWGKDFKDEINPWSLNLEPQAIKDLQDQKYEYSSDLKSLNNVPGAVAMANSGPNTNSSQFFIITEQPQPQLDGKHTVFGTVIWGMEVVRKIAAVKVDGNDRPETPVIIQKASIEIDDSGVNITSEGPSEIKLDDIKVETEKK